MLFPTLKKKKNWCKKKIPGVEFFFKNSFSFHILCYFQNIKKYWKVPLHLLVKWEVISPNSRWGQLESISIISSIPLFWFCIWNVGVVWGGGGCVMFFSHFMLFPTFIEKKIWEYQTIISHLMFSSCFFLYAGNIEKCPFTYSYMYWLNGRWFLRIVDIGNFIMRLEILKSAPSLTG